MLTVLLTDGEFTGLIRALRNAYGSDVRIIGLSMNRNMPQQTMLDQVYFVVSHQDPRYIPSLSEILEKESVDYIFPIVSEGLEQIAENEDYFLKTYGVKIISPPLSALRIANDKGLLYQCLANSQDDRLRKIVPDFIFADTKKELLDGIQKLQHDQNDVCIKRRRGEDAGGFWRICHSLDYTEKLFRASPSRVLSEQMLHLMLNTLSPDDHIPPYMVSEYLPGEEWDCDVLAKDGKLLSVTTRINIDMSGGLTTVLETKENSELAAYCAAIVQELGLSYVSCISFKKNIHDKFCILEINPRMMGNILVSCLAGNNYAKMAIDLYEGRNIDIKPVKQGIRTSMFYDQVQIPADETTDRT